MLQSIMESGNFTSSKDLISKGLIYRGLLEQNSDKQVADSLYKFICKMAVKKDEINLGDIEKALKMLDLMKSMDESKSNETPSKTTDEDSEDDDDQDDQEVKFSKKDSKLMKSLTTRIDNLFELVERIAERQIDNSQFKAIGTLQKAAMDDLSVTNDTIVSGNQLLEKALSSMVELNAKMDDLFEKVEQIDSTPIARKSIPTGSKFLRKSFDNGGNDDLQKSQTNVISVRDKVRMGKVLMELSGYETGKPELINKSFANAVQLFEACGEIEKSIVDELNKKGYQVVA
jgi:hypothetical protein